MPPSTISMPMPKQMSSRKHPSSSAEPRIYPVLGAASANRPTEAQVAVVEDFLHQLERRHPSVSDHAALLFLQLSRFTEKHLSKSNSDRAARLLCKSYLQLTGEVVVDGTFPRLPDPILRLESEESRLIYSTVCAHGRRGLLFKGGISRFRERLELSAFWNSTTLFCGLLALALSIHPIGRGIILGAVIGMAGASLNEYMVHLGVGHASDRLASLYRRSGWAGRYAEEIVLAHRVHHSKMATDFRVEFSDLATKRRVDTYLRREAKKIVAARVSENITPAALAESETKRIISDVKAGGYGVNGTAIGCITMQVLALPYFVLNGALAPYLGGWAFFLSATFFLSGFIAQSMYSHRYLHLTPADQAKEWEAGNATRFMLWFMNTPLGRLQARRHYRHHQEKIDYARTVNGAIMSFNFADFLLRGGVEEAEVVHLVKMKSERFL